MGATSTISPTPGPPVPDFLRPLDFSQLDGWAHDDHSAALACFANWVRTRPSCDDPWSRALAQIGRRLADTAIADNATARAFFEAEFVPHAPDPETGLLTAYYEPEHAASRTVTDRFRYPLYRRPPDLIELDDANRPSHMDSSFRFARRTGSQISEYFDRGAIQGGCLADRGLELFWLADPVDVFFIHIQGSARLRLDDNTTARVSYAAKTGHPYTAVGAVMIERGLIDRDNVSMQSIRRWLKEHPDRIDEILAHNRSYIFFQEIDHCDETVGPIAAAGVALTPGRSLAVDDELYPYGSPVWLTSSEPLPDSQTALNRLTIAQDTGSAIVGAARGDLFIGSGDAAGRTAGLVKHRTRFVVLIPRRLHNERGGQRDGQ